MDTELTKRSETAQVSIIGSMLIDERCIGDVLASIRPEDFPPGTCKSTFNSIRKLFLAGKPVDPVTVVDAMQGGEHYIKFLADCMDLTPTAANVLEYCEIVKKLTRLSKLADLGEQLQLAKSTEDAQELVAKINGLMVDQNDACCVTASELSTHFWDEVHSEKKPEYIHCGVEGLDKKLFLELGDMVAIGAAPSTGKTAFAIQWAVNAAKKYRVGFFSLETRKGKFADRLFSHQTPVSLSDIKRRLFPQDAWDRIGKACSEVSELQLEFVEAPGWDAPDIVSYALSKRYQIIFVDYLQIVGEGRRRKSSAYDTVTDTSMTFHTAAQRHGMLVVLLSQLSRPEKSDGKPIPPGMHSFRESGQIEQDADVGLLMYLSDPGNYYGNRKIKIGKNKEGEKGDVVLSFDGRYQTFAEVKPSPYAELNKMSRKLRRENHKGEAYDDDLEGQQEMQVLEGEDEALPF